MPMLDFPPQSHPGGLAVTAPLPPSLGEVNRSDSLIYPPLDRARGQAAKPVSQRLIHDGGLQTLRHGSQHLKAVFGHQHVVLDPHAADPG